MIDVLVTGQSDAVGAATVLWTGLTSDLTRAGALLDVFEVPVPPEPARFVVIAFVAAIPLAASFPLLAWVLVVVEVEVCGSGSETLRARFIWLVRPVISESAASPAAFAFVVVRVARVDRVGTASLTTGVALVAARGGMALPKATRYSLCCV